jgi:hypothetical protein
MIPVNVVHGLAAMTNHSSPRTTKLYDCRADEMSQVQRDL